MKKIRGIFSILVCAVLMLLSIIPAQAAANDQAVLDARNGVVKVMVYVNKHNYPSYWGSAFLINEDTVVTANHTFEDIGNDETVTKITVVAVGDVQIEAKRTSVSQERDFAVLQLNQKINGKSVLALGAPDGFNTTSNVYALGFPYVSEITTDKINYSAADVTVTNGNVSSISSISNVKYIQHSSKLDHGNSGGPLIYSDGSRSYVVGINVLGITTSDTYYYSVHIDELIEVLDALGIEYTSVASTVLAPSEAPNDDTTAPIVTTQPVTDPEPDSGSKFGMSPMVIGIIAAVVVAISVAVIVIVVVSSKRKNAPVPARNMSGGFVPPINNIPQHTATASNHSSAGSEGTTVLSQNMGDPNATTVLSSSIASAYLIRTSNNERINITKPYFKLGKDANRVDYCISGNSAVSRFHASIVSKNGQYFIVDNATTNHTYVNESMIPANVETQISNGAKIRLADEKFEFKI